MTAALQERCYWTDTAPRRQLHSTIPPESVDVAVIGAGFTGLSAALALAKRGATVAVLERHSVGWGASSRNGGMVLSGLKLPIESLVTKFGRDVARSMYNSSVEAITCVENLVRDESIDCGFARTGHLEVARKPSHFEGFRRTAEALEREVGRRVRLVDPGDLHEEIGSSAYHGGLIDDASAGLNPVRYVYGLATAAERAGATLVEEADVQKIARITSSGSTRFRLESSRGPIVAREVIAATGAYGGRTVPGLRRRMIPIGSYVITTERLRETLAREISPRGRMIYDSNYFLHYYRVTPDGRMLFGGRAAFLPESDRTVLESAEILRRNMIDVFPQLSQAKIEYAWGGTLDFTFDMLPHAGIVDGVHYAVGYAGHGVAMATYLGSKLAGVIAGDRVDEALMARPLPGAPLGLYDGTPWFLPFAGAWFKLLDWAS